MPNILLSVVVPCYNEEASIIQLLQRLHKTLTTLNISYEVIAVDDHSTDGTVEVLRQNAANFPLQIYRRPHSHVRGRAFALQDGFKLARGKLIAMLDADLQYPPEALGEMLEKVAKGADVVVANRVKKKTSVMRRFISNAGQKLFSELLHGLKVDAVSGLKLFRAEIIQRVSLHPTPWLFDLELLIKSQHAGYKIATVPITQSKRLGKSKINVLKASLELGRAALRQKTRQAEVIPFLPEVIAQEGQGFHYSGKKYIPHNKLAAHETALYRLEKKQKYILALIFVATVFGLILNWHQALLIIVGVLTFLYFGDLLFNLYLIYRSFVNPPEIKIEPEEFAGVPDAMWPSYTIFCPLYKEPEVIPQFVKAINKLDYPQDKLQVMLLLESDDKETIEAARDLDLPKHFEIVVVPESFPKTKPKACNYGLLKTRGEFCVIYDAEDVPDPQQLKKAITAFNKAGPKVACIQAKLNFYNPHQNLLTRVFTLEYSLWFDLVLVGLQSIDAPIPLGGTSNHFRTKQLRQLNGWDAFNVTEDCDLGMRLVKKGLRTAILDSTTLEEANSDLKNWIWQRSRWIKGYIQSYFVHMRNPRALWLGWQKPHVVTFQLIVGGKVMSMLINPLMWLITILYFAARTEVGGFIDSFFPPAVFYMGVFSLIFGNFLYLYYYMVGCAKRSQDDLIKYVILVPFYWLAMSIAAYLAIYKLITAPHHWSKTKHGLHLSGAKTAKKTPHTKPKPIVQTQASAPEAVQSEVVQNQPAFYSVEALEK